MTALNFSLQEDGVYAVADTLVTSDRFAPAFFTSKILPVPHLNGLICGTGSLEFILEWWRQVLGGMLATDLSHLDEFAPDSLRTIWADPAVPKLTATSTIYHLGFDDREDRFVGYAYRSTDDFRSEPLEYGTRMKPAFEGAGQIATFPDDFVEVCRQQRAYQDGIPPEDRVFVGGHVVAYMQQVQRREGVPPSVITTITRPFEFEDFGSAYLECTDGLAANMDLRLGSSGSE
jgi:hypothetical protein